MIKVEAILKGLDADKVMIQIGNTVHYLDPVEAEELANAIPLEVFKITGIA